MEPKDRILEGTNELFMQYGIRSVTMDDIARHLGISKKTIYQYYADKKDLVMGLTDHFLAKHQFNIDSNTDTADNAVQGIIGMMDCMSSMMRSVNPTMFYDLQKYFPEAWQRYKEFKDNYVLVRVKQNLQRGVKEGLYRKGMDIEIISRMRLEQVSIAFNPQTFPTSQFEPKDVMFHITDHYLHGICTLKGHKLINQYQNVKEDEE